MTHAHSGPVLFAARWPGLAHGAGYTLLCAFAVVSIGGCARGQHTTEKGPIRGAFPGGAGGVSATAGTSAYGVTTGAAVLRYRLCRTGRARVRAVLQPWVPAAAAVRVAAIR